MQHAFDQTIRECTNQVKQGIEAFEVRPIREQEKEKKKKVNVTVK